MDVGAYELVLNRTASIGAANGEGSVMFSSSAGGIIGLSSSTTCPAGGHGVIFPFGVFSFTVVGIVPGSTVRVTVTFPNVVPTNCRYYQCDGQGGWNDITSLVQGEGTSVLILSLTDGGPGDIDHRLNARITDPAGPGFSPDKAPVGASNIALPPQPVALPSLHVQSASLSASSVEPGSPVSVNAVIANSGAVNGNMKVVVYVNGQEETSRGIVVEKGGTLPIKFTLTRTEPGTYSVYVGGVSAGSFSVGDSAGSNSVLFISAGLLVVFVVGVLVLVRRRRAS